MSDLPNNPYSKQFLEGIQSGGITFKGGEKITFICGDRSEVEESGVAKFAYNRAQQDMIKAGWRPPLTKVDPKYQQLIESLYRE